MEHTSIQPFQISAIIDDEVLRGYTVLPWVWKILKDQVKSSERVHTVPEVGSNFRMAIICAENPVTDEGEQVSAAGYLN